MKGDIIQMYELQCIYVYIYIYIHMRNWNVHIYMCVPIQTYVSVCARVWLCIHTHPGSVELEFFNVDVFNCTGNFCVEKPISADPNFPAPPQSSGMSWLFLPAYVLNHIHTNTHTNTHAHTYNYMYVYINTSVRVCMCIYVYVQMYAYLLHMYMLTTTHEEGKSTARVILA